MLVRIWRKQNENMDPSCLVTTGQAGGGGPLVPIGHRLNTTAYLSIDRLQIVQNSAARLLTRSSRMSHITPILYSLHWLPINFRIKF
uniref:Uncharacterized protein n=1 Tax=Sander lucioperca TaxID=283035 RepID=A0A8C9XVY9_SANLU